MKDIKRCCFTKINGFGNNHRKIGKPKKPPKKRKLKPNKKTVLKPAIEDCLLISS